MNFLELKEQAESDFPTTTFLMSRFPVPSNSWLWSPPCWNKSYLPLFYHLHKHGKFSSVAVMDNDDLCMPLATFLLGSASVCCQEATIMRNDGCHPLVRANIKSVFKGKLNFIDFQPEGLKIDKKFDMIIVNLLMFKDYLEWAWELLPNEGLLVLDQCKGYNDLCDRFAQIKNRTLNKMHEQVMMVVK